MKVEELLSGKHVQFSRIHHPEAFTSQEEAAAGHVPGDRLAKVVVVRAADRYALAVCPATHRVDLGRLSDALGSPVRLANESEMEGIFKDAELGAEPPFGNMYGVETWVDRLLAEQDEIVFDAGTHTDFIRMSYADFEQIAKPRVAEFAERM